jgi:pyocin large subunit-like protein
MALQTKGFESLVQLNRHFSEHGDDFGARSAIEYEEMADRFLSGDKPESVHECTRACGMKLRYDQKSEAFGVLDRDGIIRTYFKPVPCSSLPGAIREAARRSGRCHPHANNLVYVKVECAK